MAPFASLPPIVPLVLLSAVLGVLAAWAFRYTSNQTGLKRVADRVRASLLALRLYKDDTAVTFRSIGGLLSASMLRLWYSLSPLIFLLVPFVLIAAQMAMYYEFRPLRPGEKTLVTAQINPDRWDELRDARLIAPDGATVLARNRDAHDHSVMWVLRADKPIGQSKLEVRAGGVVEPKQLVIAKDDGALHFVSPMRPGTSFWDRLLYPGEPAYGANAPIQKISIEYGSASTPLLGWDIHWTITFLIVSIIAALIAKPFLKVQF